MDKEQLNYIAETIKAKRKSLGYTQENFSEIIGISYSSYVKIENSLQKPSLNTVIKIAINLHLSLDKLLLGYEREKLKNKSNYDFIFPYSSEQLEIARDILTQLIAIKKSN